MARKCGRTKSNGSGPLMKEAVRVCSEIVMSEIDHANTTYYILSSVRRARDTQPKAEPGGDEDGDGGDDEGLDGEEAGEDNKGEDRKGRVPGEKPSKAKDGNLSKSGRSGLSRLRHCLMGVDRNVLKPGELDTWIDTGFRFLQLLASKDEELVRRVKGALAIYAADNTLSVTGIPEDGEVTVKKVTIESAPPQTIAFGTDRWANILRAIDPNPIQLPKGRGRKMKDDLEWVEPIGEAGKDVPEYESSR